MSICGVDNSLKGYIQLKVYIYLIPGKDINRGTAVIKSCINITAVYTWGFYFFLQILYIYKGLHL